MHQTVFNSLRLIMNAPGQPTLLKWILQDNLENSFHRVHFWTHTEMEVWMFSLPVPKVMLLKFFKIWKPYMKQNVDLDLRGLYRGQKDSVSIMSIV